MKIIAAGLFNTLVLLPTLITIYKAFKASRDGKPWGTSTFVTLAISSGNLIFYSLCYFKQFPQFWFHVLFYHLTLPNVLIAYFSFNRTRNLATARAVAVSAMGISLWFFISFLELGFVAQLNRIFM